MASFTILLIWIFFSLPHLPGHLYGFHIPFRNMSISVSTQRYSFINYKNCHSHVNVDEGGFLCSYSHSAKKKKKLWKLCFSRCVKHSRIVSKIKQVFSKHKYHVELERFVDMTILKKFIFWVPIACKETKHCAKIVVDVQMFKILFLPQQKVRSRALDYSHPFNRMINMTKTMSKVQLQRFPSPSSQGMLDNKV